MHIQRRLSPKARRFAQLGCEVCPADVCRQHTVQNCPVVGSFPLLSSPLLSSALLSPSHKQSVTTERSVCDDQPLPSTSQGRAEFALPQQSPPGRARRCCMREAVRGQRSFLPAPFGNAAFDSCDLGCLLQLNQVMRPVFRSCMAETIFSSPAAINSRNTSLRSTNIFAASWAF